MKISLKWIKELLPDLRATPSAVEKRLTAAGIEVDAVEHQAESLAGIVAAEVKELAPHPDADNLQVAQVFDGEETHTVVCGAPNVQAGQKVAFAPVGVSLAAGFSIAKRKIRGVESTGMICSEMELGITDHADGILVLKPRSRPGKPLAEILDLKDVRFELSVTPNRPDVLSHLGIARELAALYRMPLPKTSVRVRDSGGDASELARVEIRDGKRCAKYIGRVITGVQQGPSPSWLQQKLRAAGVRSISNVVDATNLVLMELGHPLHAFDLDKLRGRKIVVRTANKGEVITIIDGTERQLDEDDLVIADAKLPVAIAGVMGGLESEVTEGTTNVLLESAMFDPRSVRRTAKRHGLHTEASHRFERGADPGIVEVAVDRCAQLVVELAGGTIHKGQVGVVKSEGEPLLVPIRPERASMVIGRDVGRKEVREILAALGLKSVKKPKTDGKKKTKQVKKDALLFSIPSWRVDLRLEEDLIEEVARVIGYDEIPTVMPERASAVWKTKPDRDYEREIRQLLADNGFLEAISLAFNSKVQAEEVGVDERHTVFVANPLGEESQLMRVSLLPALIEAARRNQNHLPSITDLRLFEVGKTFCWSSPPTELPVERLRLGILMRGRRTAAGWTQDKDLLDAFDLKAVVEQVLGHFGIENASFIAHEEPWLHPRSGTRIEVGGAVVGLFGEAHPDLLAKKDIEGPPLFLSELSLEKIATASTDVRPFRAMPKLPPAQRDLSFFVERDIPASRVLQVINGSKGAESLESVEIFDVYEGKGVPDGKKSLAVSMTWRSKEQTLTDAAVETAQTSIVESLSSQLGAAIRDA